MLIDRRQLEKGRDRGRPQRVLVIRQIDVLGDELLLVMMEDGRRMVLVVVMMVRIVLVGRVVVDRAAAREGLQGQQVGYLAGRAAHGETGSPSLLVEAAAAAAAHRGVVVVQRYRVALRAQLAREDRAVGRYHVALQSHRTLRRLQRYKDLVIYLAVYCSLLSLSNVLTKILGFEYLSTK